MKMLLPLTPSESKRMIAKAIVKMPLVKQRMKKGKIAISNGSTTGFVVEELLHKQIDIARFPSGVISHGRVCETPKDRIRTVFIENGKEIERHYDTDDYADLVAFYEDFGAGDLYIKGANAVDSQGNAGFFLGHPSGGNVMLMYAKVAARGVPFLIPVGLEKLVSSVPEAGRHVCGNRSWDYHIGMPVGYLTVTDGIVITEIEAVRIICGAEATHIGSGGVGGGEGTVVLSIDGSGEQLETLAEFVEGIKGEPQVSSYKKRCTDCTQTCSMPVINN